MKKNWFSMMLIAAFAVCPMMGCGNNETSVVAPPAETTDDGSAMEGMSDDEYNKEMEASMSNQQG